MRRAPSDPKLFWLNISLLTVMALAFCMVVGIAVWGVSRDFYHLRGTFIDSESDRIRSHAERTVAMVESLMHSQKSTPNELPSEVVAFLRTRWQTSVAKDESRLYGAILNAQNEIVIHSDPKMEGQRLEAIWYDHVVMEAGPDAVDSKSSELTGGKHALDIRIPIMVHGKVWGSYHSGLSFEWIEKELNEKKAHLWSTWSWTLTAMFIVLAAMTFFLVQVNRRTILLREYVKFLRVRRFAEVGQLMTGVIHEIRNPLNAMRLNLHVTEGFMKGLSQWLDVDHASASEQQEIVQESIHEIDRMEALLHTLLGYVRPETSQPQPLEVRQEVEATLTFLKPILEGADIAVTARFAEAPAIIRIDRDRFRQILINLLNNAVDAIGGTGHIQISVQANRENVLIVLTDDGHGVPIRDLERIFEPFFSTKETGNGLGLALVRRYIEEVGGSIHCQPNAPKGAQFHLRFPVDASDEFVPLSFKPVMPSV